MLKLLNTSRNHGSLPSPLYLTVQFGSIFASAGKSERELPPMLVYVERNAGTITSALYLLTVPFSALNSFPARMEPAGYVAPAYWLSTLWRKPSSELQNFSNDAEWYPLLASPVLSNAEPRLIVVIVNVPLCVVGIP